MSKNKKGLFQRLVGNKPPQKSTCCCSFELEELPEEDAGSKNKKESSEDMQKDGARDEI